MAKKYSCFVLIPVGIRVENIVASSQEDAAALASYLVTKQIGPIASSINTKSFSPNFKHCEYADDGPTLVLVDEDGDEHHEKSTWFKPDEKRSNTFVPADRD